MKQKVKVPINQMQKALDAVGNNQESIDLGKVILAMGFIRMFFNPIKAINFNHNSNGLRHVIQRAYAQEVEISNTDLVFAMVLCGYNYQKLNESSHIARFNVCTISRRREAVIRSEIKGLKRQKKKHGKLY